MLKTASIFKDFFISVNANNTAVTFRKNGVKAIQVKNDNFAQQVQILDNAGTTNLFDYKYITFDNSAVFEITDCIKNGNYTTLFIQYLSNITFDTEDSNFCVEAVSVSKLQKLGLNINDFIKILGNNITLNFSDVSIRQFVIALPAIKLRLSEIPQNLNYNVTGTGQNVETTTENNFTNYTYSQSIHKKTIYPANKWDFVSMDNSISVIIFIPPGGLWRNRVVYNNGNTGNDGIFNEGLHGFFKTLNALITDLTLSAEITLINDKTIFTTPTNKYITYTTNTDFYNINLPELTAENFNKLKTSMRVVSSTVTEGTSNGSICFIMGLKGIDDSSGDGFLELFNIIDLPLFAPSSNPYIWLNLNIFGQLIDLTDYRTGDNSIQRGNQFLRVYIDAVKNIYQDIPTSLEYAKNAYSNFEAYQKSNIELINKQSAETLKQQQQQQRSEQTLTSITAGTKALSNSLFAFGMGNVAGGIGQLIGGATNVATDEIKFNMKQQNDTANNKLAAAQTIEKARATISPTSEIKGSLTLNESVRVGTLTDNFKGKLLLYACNSIVFNNMTLSILERYIFENAIMDKITDVSQIQKPEWQTLNNYYQMRIRCRGALNTRKDLIIYVEDEQQ